MGLIPVSTTLILAINKGQYGGWIVPAYLVVALWVTTAIVGWFFRRRRLARLADYVQVLVVTQMPEQPASGLPPSKG